MLKAAEKGGYGIGSFSARNTYLIDAVLKGAQETKAPVIVQISANEFNWFDVTQRNSPTVFMRYTAGIRDRPPFIWIIPKTWTLSKPPSMPVSVCHDRRFPEKL